MGRNGWNFDTDEVKKYPVLIVSALKIITLIHGCVVAHRSAHSIEMQHAGQRVRRRGKEVRAGPLTGGCFLHLLPLPLLLLSLENIQRNT